MSALLWPYPLLLSTRKLVHPDSTAAWIVAYVVGLLLVVGCSLWAGRALGRRSDDRRFVVPLGLAGWAVPLVAVELLALGAAAALGWPIGV
jgi:hypothetical protein